MRNLITTRKAAQQLGVSPRQVQRLVHDNQLKPAAKLDGIRGAFLFEVADVIALKRSRDAA